jgi:hypothetical protein
MEVNKVYIAVNNSRHARAESLKTFMAEIGVFVLIFDMEACKINDSQIGIYYKRPLGYYYPQDFLSLFLTQLFSSKIQNFSTNISISSIIHPLIS